MPFDLFRKKPNGKATQLETKEAKALELQPVKQIQQKEQKAEQVESSAPESAFAVTNFPNPLVKLTLGFLEWHDRFPWPSQLPHPPTPADVANFLRTDYEKNSEIIAAVILQMLDEGKQNGVALVLDALTDEEQAYLYQKWHASNEISVRLLPAYFSHKHSWDQKDKDLVFQFCVPLLENCKLTKKESKLENNPDINSAVIPQNLLHVLKIKYLLGGEFLDYSYEFFELIRNSRIKLANELIRESPLHLNLHESIGDHKYLDFDLKNLDLSYTRILLNGSGYILKDSDLTGARLAGSNGVVAQWCRGFSLENLFGCKGVELYGENQDIMVQYLTKRLPEYTDPSDVFYPLLSYLKNYKENHVRFFQTIPFDRYYKVLAGLGARTSKEFCSLIDIHGHAYEKSKQDGGLYWKAIDEVYLRFVAREKEINEKIPKSNPQQILKP